jgi:hypothetical protein
MQESRKEYVTVRDAFRGFLLSLFKSSSSCLRAFVLNLLFGDRQSAEQIVSGIRKPATLRRAQMSH